MKQKIVDAAKSIGISIIGFTNILDYSYLSDFLTERQNNGYSCEFEEQDIYKRLDVRNVFPQCKSIIAIGVPYAEGYNRPSSYNKGLISVVSYGEDYHKYLNFLLNSLATEIKKHVDFEYKVCVDTSPLIDREICKNAGIGNYGKNSMLINEKYGSFLNIGYLLTSLEIECTEGQNNNDICTDCDICIKSCPNKAIFREGGINATRCVSYLTQTKNYIPLDYRKSMKNQIYGCDICQVVCPKNKKNSEKLSNIDTSKLRIDLEELLNISNKEYLDKYGNLAGSWRGRNVWKRNALIAIGNLQLTHLFESVEKELNNSSPMIKMYAAWCLMNLNREKAVKILHNQLKIENDTIKTEFMKLAEAEYDSGNL